MDAATTSARDARRCARPGCADLAAATLAFRYDRQQAWLTTLAQEKSPATYDLCGPCADRTAPPRGWELVDERPDLDGLADPVQDRDGVRAAIAAALRSSGTATAARALSVVPDPPAELPDQAADDHAADQDVAPLAAAPAPADWQPVALAPSGPPDPSVHVEPPMQVEPPSSPPSSPPSEAPAVREPAVPRPATLVADRADRPHARRRRRRPVEVLIEGPQPSDEPAGTARTWRVTTSHQPGSHAPTSHRLGTVVLSQPPLPVPAAAATEPAATVPAATGPAGGVPDSTGAATTEPPPPAPLTDVSASPGRARPSTPVPAEPAVATAVDVPLAFDTMPDRLVQVEPPRSSTPG